MTQQPDSTPKIVAGSDQAANEAVPAAQRTPSAGQAPPAAPEPAPPGPPPTAARPPVAPVQPGDQSLQEQQEAQDTGDGEDLSTQAAELEDQLAKVRAKARGNETVRLKVEPPHSGLILNNVYVGDDWTEVPTHIVPAMMEGAANSGVTLTQDETES